MNIALLLRGIKKRDWVIGAALAFVLSIAVCVFESTDLSLNAPSFWQFVLCCAVFFGAIICVFATEQPWLPLVVAVGGAAVIGVFARPVAMFFFTVLLPAILWLWLLRFFSADGKRQNRFGLLCLVLSALLLAAIVFLVVKRVSLHVPYDFFLSRYNSSLSGFWPLVFLFFVFVLYGFWELRGKNRAKAARDGQKKKKGKTKKRPDGVPVWGRFAPPLLFFISAALCYVYFHYADGQILSYPLLISLSALFVLLGTVSFSAAEPENAPPPGQKK